MQLQNFVVGSQITATWLNQVDQLLVNGLGGAQTTAQVLNALGLGPPVPIGSGGTGANNAAAALVNLGGTTLAAAVAAALAGVESTFYPITPTEAAVLAAQVPVATVVNPFFPAGYVDRYIANGAGVDCTPAFNAAFKVAQAIGCSVRFGATAPYQLNEIVNYTSTTLTNEYGVTTIYDGCALWTTASSQPLKVNHSLTSVFDCTGTLGCTFERVGIATINGNAPKVCWLFARSQASQNPVTHVAASAGYHQLKSCVFVGACLIGPYYNYGSEDNSVRDCVFVNTATTASTTTMKWTSTNANNLTSLAAGGGIATGPQSTIDHTVDGCQLFNLAGTATSYTIYFDSVAHVRIKNCHSVCSNLVNAGGEAHIGVDQTNGPTDNVTIDCFLGENSTPNLPKYGIQFFNGPSLLNASWSVTNSVFPNANLAISCNGSLLASYLSNITEAGVQHGFAFTTLSGSKFEYGGIPTTITNSTGNELVGAADYLTVTTRTNDYWIDTGTAYKTWVPNISALTTTGAAAVVPGSARMLLHGNLCTLEFAMSSTGTIAPTAGQAVTGTVTGTISGTVPIPAAKGHSEVQVVDATTPVNLGTGVMSGANLLMPAFNVGTDVVVVRSTYFVA